MTSFADLLASSGKVTGAFSKESPVGTTVQGVIDDAAVRQVNHYETGEPEFWSDGNPKLQVAVILQTDLRDPMNPEDDGRRGVYIKWWGDSRKELERAIKAAGDTDLRKGGLFMARFTGEKPNDNPRLNATKLFSYAYQMPAQTAGLNLAGDQLNQQTGELSQPPAAAPVQQPMTFPAANTQAAIVNAGQQQVQAFAQQQQAAPPANTAPQADPWGPAQAAPVSTNGWPESMAPAPQMGTTDAAQAALAQQLGAQVIQPPAPVPTGAPAAPPELVAKVKQFIGFGMNDGEVAGATGAPLDLIAALRNLP